MSIRSLSGVLAVLLGVALLAGCGGGSKSGTTSGSASVTTSSSSTAGAGEAAVAYCEKIIDSQTHLPAKAKHKLAGACAKVAKGDTSAVKVVEREICEEVAGTSSSSSSARKAALAACRK